MSHHDGSDNGKFSPKRDECSKWHAKSNSPHQSDNPKDRYKRHGDFNNVWEMFPCTFCHATNHCLVDCEQRKVLVKIMEQILRTRYEEPLSVMKNSLSMGKHKKFCTHCSMNGHHIEKCWKLHPQLHPKKDKEVMRYLARRTIGGKVESNVVPKEAFEVERMQKDNP